MTTEVQDKIIKLAKLIGAIGVIQGAIFAIATPFFFQAIDNRVEVVLSSASFKIEAKALIDDYIASAEFALIVDRIISEYEEELSERDSQVLKLRVLLAMKMGIDEDEVHIEIGKLYKDYGHFKNVSAESIKKVIIEINKLDTSTKLDVPRF